MAQAVVCRACGAKIKEGRPQCLRCGEPLAAAEEPRPRRWGKYVPAGRGPLLLGGSVLALGVLLAAVTVLRPSGGNAPAPSPAQPSAPRPAPATRPAAAPAPVVEAPGADPPFLDVDRGGTAAYTRGDYQTALERYRQAVARNPKDLEAVNNLGQVLARLGQPADAIPYFERAIALDEARWAPRFNLAHAYGQLGDWTRAAAEYRVAAERFPDDYVTHFNLALALRKGGREALAVTEFERAVQLAPAEPSFRLSLGTSYERLDRATDAARAYREYLELAPDAPDAGKVKAKLQELAQPARSLPPGGPAAGRLETARTVKGEAGSVR